MNIIVNMALKHLTGQSSPLLSSTPVMFANVGNAEMHADRLSAVKQIDFVFYKHHRFRVIFLIIMAELLLDPDIRVWVFLPIVVITFLVGIVRHYVSILLATQKRAELQQLQDSQVMIRAHLLRENGHYLPRSSFFMRRHFFNNEETGYFKTQKRAAVSQNPMTDPSMMTEMLKGNITTVLPMIIIGGWINWTFSGFVTTKVPFPLTLRFKPMLQRGIELVSLDAAWVSSASWYFLNVFGLRSIYTLVLGENNAADQSQHLQDQMSGAAMAMPPDPKVAFKAEWEALEICEHRWALENIEGVLVGNSSPAIEQSS